MNLDAIRKDFPVLKDIVYLDNAASSQTPLFVLDKVREYYTEYRANIHRGLHRLSIRSSEEYEKAHEKTAKTYNVSEKGVVFTRNTTESLNLIAHVLLKSNFNKDIVTSKLEHHANLIPWQMLSKGKGVNLKFIDVGKDGVLQLENLDKLIDRKTGLVSVSACSNVTGISTPYREVLKHAKDCGAITVLDAAQLSPHEKFDFRKTNADFIAFSSHKMCGPTGIGVLLCNPSLAEDLPTFLVGGDMIKDVSLDDYVPANMPQKYEAGTPDIGGAIGFGAALDYLDKIGWDNIEEQEKKISSRLFHKAQNIGIDIFGSLENRGPVLTFKVHGGHPHDVANFLDSKNIAVRSGMHCAHPFSRLLANGPTTRASFYFYNTLEEVDYLISSLEECIKFFDGKKEEEKEDCI